MQTAELCLSFTLGSLFTNLILAEALITIERVRTNEANTMAALHKGSRQPGRCFLVPCYSKTQHSLQQHIQLFFFFPHVT